MDTPVRGDRGCADRRGPRLVAGRPRSWSRTSCCTRSASDARRRSRTSTAARVRRVGVRRHRAHRRAAAGAVGPRRSPLVRLPGVARVPQPLRRDVDGRDRALGARLPACSVASGACSSRSPFAGFVTYVTLPGDPAVAGEPSGRHAPHRARSCGRCGTSSACSDVAAVFGREEQVRVPGGRAAVAPRGVAVPRCCVFFWPVAGRWRAAARRVRARDGVHARVHRRPLRVRHPARLGLRDRRGRSSSADRLGPVSASTGGRRGPTPRTSEGQASMRRPLR